jgi:hypothetical protein
MSFRAGIYKEEANICKLGVAMAGGECCLLLGEVPQFVADVKCAAVFVLAATRLELVTGDSLGACVDG